MRCEERAATVDGRFPIYFKCIGKIVVLNSKEDSQKIVCNPIQKEFEPRILHNSSARQETASKNTVISFIERVPVPSYVANVVRFVGHHDNHAIATCAIQAPDDRSPEPMRPGVSRRREIGDAKLQLLYDLPGVVAATIVNDHDLVRYIVMT